MTKHFCIFYFAEIAESEADISFFAERHDADTRQWLFEDFENWFNDPGDSRAYVLLGDAGVGKSVIAGALAQREKNAGHLGAAYFCRHNDDTRNDPRYLLGTVACQLCKCNSLYSNIVGGGNGVRMMLANSKLGVSELFTKLLQEPLGKCTPCKQRKLVIIDALDETEYESREDFLDLLMHRFPRLPKWLLFFITSRPEDTVQFRLKKYNPCIKICAGNGEHLNVYQQHEQDIRRFLEKRVDFPRLPYSVEELVKTCSGLFLYAFYIAKVLNDQGHLGKIDQLSDLFPGNIDNFFQENFQRVFNKVGAELSKKLFGCVIAAPSPLPLSFILFVLKRENSNLDEQEVIDALSQFVVLRTSDETFAFLHNLIPSWLTDRKKAQTFFVDRIEAGEYLRKIIVEFLPAAINDGSKKHPYIENNIFEYVLRVGVRVLCGFDEKDSMNIVYSCLTSYHFIQRRIQNSRIQVYSVIGDFKLSARSQTLGDAEKEILQEICTVLESNIYTLQECPHLLPSCLRSASKNGQLHMAVPDGVSTTWMEWSCFPATHGQRCFSLSPDGKLLAEGKGKYISLFDSCSLERFSGPIEVEELSHLTFSADGSFVFFGRLDKWLSVERGRIEAISQFSENVGLCEWGSFTLDQKNIVVKRKRLSHRCALCLFNHLCLWAKEEIAQSQESEQLCSCFPHKVSVERRFPHLGAHQKPCITAMRPLLDLLGRMQCDQWCLLLEKVELEVRDGTFLLRACCDCKSLREYETLTLTEVRQFIVDHYSEIFKYQVWNVKTGKSALEEAFSSGVGFSPFTYFCHLGTVFEICGTLFTGVEKALSFCNVALLNAVCHHLLFRREDHLVHFKLSYVDFSSKNISPEGEWLACRVGDSVHLFRESASLKHPVYVITNISDFCFCYGSVFLYFTGDNSLCVLCLQTGTTTILSIHRYHYHRFTSLGDLLPFSTYVFADLSSDDSNSALETVLALSTVSSTIALEVQNLPDKGKKELFSGSIPCILPGRIWVATPRVSDKTTVDLFCKRDQNQRFNSKGPAYVIKEVAHFGFTSDYLFFLYLTVDNSLHALSLETGTIRRSVLVKNPVFIQERYLSYILFNEHNDETLVLNDFPVDFLKFFLVPVVKKPIQATFVSGDAFLVLFLDSTLMLLRATSDEHTDTLASESFLTNPCGTLCLKQVKKGEFSPDGKLIAVHHDNEISLHDTAGTTSSTYLCSIFEADYEFSVVQLTFSADGTLLFFCILRGSNCPFVYVWDVQKKVTSASFDSPGLLSEDFCCCFSSDNKKLVLCTELNIEIWDHAARPCRLLARMGNDVLYSEADKFTHCAMSQESNLLACCIVDRILLYSLNNHANQPVLELPRAHLGKIQFCQFLRGNRYIISCGVDGAVFLWDLNEQRAISYARIAQGRERIVIMTVSPEEDQVICLTSFGRYYVIKLCGLNCQMPSLQFQSQRTMRELNATTFMSVACSDDKELAEDTDIPTLIEEMDFMIPSDDSEDMYSDEDYSEKP